MCSDILSVILSDIAGFLMLFTADSFIRIYGSGISAVFCC